MRFPIVLQHDSTDCGPAVLAMMAAHRGKRLSMARLREMSGTDRQGTSLAGLIVAAERVGFAARSVRCTADGLAKIALPVVAHWHEDHRHHFVVLYKITTKCAFVADPARGRRKLPIDEFRTNWTGVLLLLAETPKLREVITSKPSFVRLCLLLLPHRRLFLDVLLAAVLITILGLTSSFFIQALVDFVFVFGRKSALNWLGLGMLIVLVARSAFLALRTCLLAHLSQRIDADTLLGYHRHLLGLPLSFFTSRRTGEILARINDAFKIRLAVSAATLSIIVDALLLIAATGIMLAINRRVTLIPIAVIPVIGAFVWLLNKPMRRHQRAAMEKGADIEAQMVETVAGIQTVKALRAETHARVRMEARVEEMLEAAFRSQMLAGHCSALTAAAAGLSGLALLWFGGREVLDGRMTVGELMALHAMLGMFMAPLERLSGSNQTIQDAVVASERLGEVLELDLERAGQRACALDRPIDGLVEFRNVTFQYGSRRPVIENFSLRIERGECAGIIGESGSGKTTLVNLLGRFLEPAAGTIRIDGIDIRDYTFECLRREIAFVPQDIVLFNGSIADNIRLGRPRAEPQDVHAAARAAHVDRIAAKLPQGFDTPVGERGLSLSGGERQRIALARALLQDPAILVLDEPTSHLDAESESAVEAILNERRGRRTTIVISHRALTFDRIIDMNASVLTKVS